MLRLKILVLIIGSVFWVHHEAGGAACGEKAASDTTIVYSFPSNVGPLNPHLYAPNQMFAQEMVYEGLVELGDDGRIEPCLAERWEISPDGLEYRFFLRKDVVFSDGQVLNAAVVEKNFQAVMMNRGRHQWLPLAETIKSFYAVGEYEFILRLKEPYYPVLADLALPRPFRLLSPAAFPESGDTRGGVVAPVGTGPWRLVKTALGQYDLFERNEHYWRDVPKATSVLVKVIPDPLSRMVALETGEIDLIYGLGQISFDAFEALRRNPDTVTLLSKPVGTLTLAVNSSRGPTRSLVVRQALQYAFDKSAVIAGVLLGGQKAADTLFARTVPYCDIALVPYSFDPARAAVLLDGAGWIFSGGDTVRKKDGAELVLEYCFMGNDPVQKAIGEVLQSQLANVGIRLVLLGEEEDAYLRRQKEGDFGLIVSATWGPPFEPHAMLGSMRQPSHADYMAQAGLPMKADLDRKITQALSEQDETVRQGLYTDVLTTLHEQAVYMPVFYISGMAAYKRARLAGVTFAPGRTKIPFERVTVK